MQNLTCPIDQNTLLETKTSGEESSKCPECKGVWLSFDALVSLEDRAASDDMVKGQRQYGKHDVDHMCPHCGEQMTRFRYRGYNLEIEACPNEAGFWLDENEDREIRDVVKVDVKEDRNIEMKMLFDAGHSLEERILAEQFVH